MTELASLLLREWYTQNDNDIWVKYTTKHADTRDVKMRNYYKALAIDLKYNI